MKRKGKHLLIGVILIITSIVVLYYNLKNFEGGFAKLWPALVLLFGMFLYIYYFSTKKRKNRLFLLFLATFLAISSIPLFILTFTSFTLISDLWPGFLFAFGIGILSLYFYGKKKKILLFLSSIIIAASLLVWIFSVRSQFFIVIGVVLLIVGAAFLTRGLIKEADLIPEKEEDKIIENEENV